MRKEIASALHRLAWQIGGKPRQRGWKAGRPSATFSRWLSSPRPIDYDVRNELRVLRARSRVEAQNNDHVRHFLRLCKTNVIGPQGIKLQARVKGRDGAPDDVANDAIEESWKEWGKRGSCDVTERQSWKGYLRLLVETVARDGEAITRKVTGWDGNRFRFALQMVDPESLDVQYNDTLPNGNRITMGVELDEYRRRVAYHLIPESRQSYASSYLVGERVRLPADEVEHTFLPEWVWLTRGIPWTATALQRLHGVAGYEDAEIINSQASSTKMGFYKQTGEGETEYAGDGDDLSGNPTQQLNPGEIEILPPGYEFQGWDPTHPTTQFGDFVKAMLRGIASGLGVNYNTLANDLEHVNYTSLRHGSLTERDVWMLLQDWVIEEFCEPIYRDWLAVSLLNGQIKPPAGQPYSPLRANDFQRVSWQPRRWQWVDPEKEMKANQSAYDLRTRSISSIIRDTGQEPDEVWDEIASEAKRMEEKGVPAPLTSATTAPAAETEGETDDDE